MHQSAYRNLGKINVKDFSFSAQNQIIFFEKGPAPEIQDYSDEYLVEAEDSVLVATKTGDYKVCVTVFLTSETKEKTPVNLVIARKRQMDQESPLETYQAFGGDASYVEIGKVSKLSTTVVLPLGEKESIAFFLEHNLGSEIEIPVNVVGLQINAKRV